LLLIRLFEKDRSFKTKKQTTLCFAAERRLFGLLSNYPLRSVPIYKNLSLNILYNGRAQSLFFYKMMKFFLFYCAWAFIVL